MQIDGIISFLNNSAGDDGGKTRFQIRHVNIIVAVGLFLLLRYFERLPYRVTYIKILYTV